MINILNIKNLLFLQTPRLHFISCVEKDIDDFVYCSFASKNLLNNGSVIKIIRGKRCMTKSGLFQEWAAALQFPSYFGHNWDAFDECITELDWMPAKNYIFFITRVNLILTENKFFSVNKEFKIFINLLKKAGEEWAKELKDDPWFGTRSAVPFHVVFHSESEEKDITLQKFKKTGIKLDHLEIKKLKTIKAGENRTG